MFAKITDRTNAVSSRRDAPASIEKAELSTAGLNERERKFLAACQKVYRDNTGVTTPFNYLICSLIWQVAFGTSPTPEDVETELTEFRENFDDMKGHAAAFMQAYPEEFQERHVTSAAESRTTLN